MSPEPFDSRAKAPPAKRWEKGCGDENAREAEKRDPGNEVGVFLQPRSQGLLRFQDGGGGGEDPGTHR